MEKSCGCEVARNGGTVTASTAASDKNRNDNGEVADGQRVLAFALPMRRVKNGRIGRTSWIGIDDDGCEGRATLSYAATRRTSAIPFGGCRSADGGERRKKVNLSEILEVRQGYRTDGLQKACREYKFCAMAPEERCFSIIFKHPHFVHKSIDFICVDLEQTLCWVNALREHLASNNCSQTGISFNEKQWLLQNFRQADLDRNGEIAFGELWRLLKRMNLQLSEQYVHALFKESVTKSGKPRNALDKDQFLALFEVLTDLPEYRSALRLANGDGNDFLDAAGLQQFLTEEQQFKDIDEKKAQAIINYCEPTGNSTLDKSSNNASTDEKERGLLTTNGFRRLLQSRWGNILREGHESIFQDMDQPLQFYYINSSHNTYLTGLQVRGNATVEGYISALRKGSRLLELDLFDGDHGEPQITHKRTFIGAISLKNVLRCVLSHGFVQNPYPIILTIENHVGIAQQRVMADIFREILGEHLFMPPEDFHTKPLPSPNQLKKKVLLRGKTTTTSVVASAAIATSTEDPDQEEGAQDKLPQSPVDPKFSKLIALPSVKLTPNNLYYDIKNHASNGSPSISERKVLTYLEANAPIATYTATHFVKSYPSGIRQDSSNMNPMQSWICGIQSVAMNFQTCDEELDLNKGFFSVNGNIGYILKPKMLNDGIDPRHMTDVKCTLEIAIICAQYLPKEPGSNGIIDPFVCLQIFGVPRDEKKYLTHAVRNNGFNPVWNETFKFALFCPELAVLRVCVKDFDRTSSDEFVGEFSVPVSSIRPGYSHVRLNTGTQHTPDEAASIFIRTAFS